MGDGRFQETWLHFVFGDQQERVMEDIRMRSCDVQLSDSTVGCLTLRTCVAVIIITHRESLMQAKILKDKPDDQDSDSPAPL